MLVGIGIGFAAAAFIAFRGDLPFFPGDTAEFPVPDPEAGETMAEAAPVEPDEPDEPRYDFFTVLPEMEVVVPERELRERADEAPEAATAGTPADRYVLQAGSFRSASDAEQLKARLALLGLVAQVQTVTVDAVTWHRVRLGPVDGARAADELRRRLDDEGFDAMVMKASG
jgi:cell division protein FtsN